MSIDLRFSDVDPPEEEPNRTIYADITSLPDTLKLGLTLRLFNYDDITLYMKVDGSHASWTFTENELAHIGSGFDKYYNIDRFGTRARPGASAEEIITVRLRAYTDAGYTDLKWTFERSITVIFIKSDDGSWTQDELDNFDDGTVMGWAVANENANYTGYPKILVVNDYVLSVPDSIQLHQYTQVSGRDLRARLFKEFTTPDRANVYCIIDLRMGLSSVANLHLKYLKIQRDDDALINLGMITEYNAYQAPLDRWIRIVFPLPADTTLTIKIIQDAYISASHVRAYVWIDDFRIISKD